MNTIVSKTIDVEATCQNIKRLSRERGITPKEVAEHLGFTSVTAVYKWYEAKCLPSLDNLVALGDFFDVSVDEILIVKDIRYDN